MAFKRQQQRDSIEIEVYPKEGESGESLIRRFRKKVNNSGILKELKAREFYIKPSVRRRNKRKEAIQRCKLEEIKKEKLQSTRERKHNEKD